MKQKTKLIFSTNNDHKLGEVQAILKENFEVVGLKDIGCDVDIPETADTLEGNALIKARYLWNNLKTNCFADDTGLEVEALGNAPGVYSARYAGEGKSSQDNVAKLLKNLENSDNRKARFRTVIAYIENGEEFLFEGIAQGIIETEQKGTTGFGYDPIFMPDGYNKTFAELGDKVKNEISHRALAVNKLYTFLINRK